MGKIIVLDENTSNKIAAGEVVERPASVIKELVENSIDAGATSISVDIKNGGISYIKVTDNGSGMDEDDVEIAFERHATSKIKRAEDLDSIITMGFRGEALASIAAVSSVELQTKTASSTYGMYVHVVGGVFKEVRQTGCPVGTTFIVKDLFFNTPARYKFLKKDSTEATYISDTISRIALGNPNIAFKLTSGKSTLVHTPGNNDLKSAIFSVYGKEILKELLEVDYQDERFKISGYVGKPESARANRNYQSLYINKRYVKSRTVSYAVEQAYSSILMKNKFPFFVLNIELNPGLVDANVHPAKMDVRFADESYLSRAIYMAVSKALNSSSLFNPVSVPAKDRELFKIKITYTKKEYIQEQLIKQKYTMNEADDFTAGTIATQSKPQISTDTPAIEQKKYIQPQYSEFAAPKEKAAALNDISNNVIDKSHEIRMFTKALEPLAKKDIIKNVKDVSESTEKENAGHREIIANASQYISGNYNVNQDMTCNDNKISENCDKNSYNSIDTLVCKDLKSEAENNTDGISDITSKDNSNQSLLTENDRTNSLVSIEKEHKDYNSEIRDDIKKTYIKKTYNEETYNTDTLSDSDSEKTQLELADMKYIGQAFSTYIILQNGNELVLVDQHAAHERIIFEKLKTKFETQENTTQLLLEPVVIQLQAFELESIKSNIELFNKIGFVFEDFGNNSIILRGIPYLMEGYSPKEIFLELADKIQESVKPVNTPVADEMIHTIACKAAIKANKKLDDKEVHQLLTELANTGRRYTCPHGRPTIVRLTKYEIEKMFKRII
ncbi:DNA mismatch repair endonuclease MutL [Ruminiclostridium herbifermentans]|uniref:DNA mismatch repair protein MutL n=1 Tax=Ruminiclostridium herbifermentans TaxID=2488810 RepID=A0A4U7JIU4_9FIRM|nr:DNA mismatch repair endonuclease MutL [Ruminiclostridium herbifermentans]QNU65289.1 DNA mismatch repair endonuclease MutL [Ruminiclostridium herbifermentans]